MNGIIHTKHFNNRLQKRGIDYAIIMALLYYGECRSSRHGTDSLIFTKASLAEIKADYGHSAFKACEKFKNVYLIVSQEGALITVARSYR